MKLKLSLTDRWRAGCAERCKPGSEGGVRRHSSAVRLAPTLPEYMVKEKIIVYQREVTAKADAEKAKIAAKVEAGKMSFDKAVQKIEKLPEAPTTVQGKNGEIETRTVRKVRIIDVSKLPPQYLIPDEVKVRKDGLAGVAKLINSGAIEVYEDATVAVKV
jgi:hypothetical protein